MIDARPLDRSPDAGGEAAAAPRPSPLFTLLDRLSVPIALVGIACLIAVGLFGMGKPKGTWLNDFYWYYAGGRCFWLGSNMYDAACFAREFAKLLSDPVIAGLAYPPHFAPFAAAVAAVSTTWSGVAFIAISLTATALLIPIAADIERQVGAAEHGKALGYGVLVAIVLGNSGIWGAIWMGQLTPIVALSLWGAFALTAKGRDVAAGALLAIAALKPQISLFVFLWFLLNGRIKPLIVAGVVIAILSSYVVAVMGVRPAIAGWLHGVATYQDYPVNRLGDASVEGVPSILAVFGITLPLAIATAIGAAIVVVLRVARRSPPFAPLALAALLSLQLVIFSRPLDAILLAPAFALMWPHAGWRSSHIALFVVAAAVFCVPRPAGIVDQMGPVLAHFRTGLLIVFCALFVRQLLKGGERIGAPSPAGPAPAFAQV